MNKLFVLFSLVLINCSATNNSDSSQYWARTYEGTNNDYPYKVQHTLDGGYIVTGFTKSFGAGDEDVWILKLDSLGVVSWEKTYGGLFNDRGTSIQQTSDAGYIAMSITGSSRSKIWIWRLSSDGDSLWQKTYGSGEIDRAYSFQQTTGEGYVITGYTITVETWNEDAWIMKLDSDGDIIWKKSYIGNEDEKLFSIKQTLDKGYIAAGSTNSFGIGETDSWVIKLDNNGDILWQKTYGGSSRDEASAIEQTLDGGYIVVGRTYSFGAGKSDLWLLKLKSDGNIEWQKTYGGRDHDGAVSCKQLTNGEYVVTGATYSFGTNKSDSWLMKLDNNGNIMWQKIYKANNYDGFRDFAVITDNELIVLGYVGSSLDSNQYIRLFKLNSIGDIPGCNMIDESNADIADTFIEPLNSNATVQTSSFIMTNTNTVLQNTNSMTNVVCCYDTEDFNPPPSGNGIGDLCDCEGNFDCDSDCDGTDAATFKVDFGRSTFDNPCEEGDPCNGDFDCDGDCDGTDAAGFKFDFGRSSFNSPCPACTVEEWCNYPSP